MSVTPAIAQLEEQLSDFDPGVRAAALRELLRVQPQRPAPAEVANMHCHSFFSFNPDYRSPSALAWLGRQRGFKLMGLVDFDVLDGVSEFLDACALAEVCGSAGIEARTFLPEFADTVINSPGEPGVLYHMGIGFATTDVNPAAAAIVAELRAQSAQRNLGLIGRVNAHLDPVQIDYAADVLPLTPAGNATERHIISAYIQAAARVYPNDHERVAFWSKRLDVPRMQMEDVIEETPDFRNLIRARLMKKGGVGYVQPDSGSFPPVDKLHELILACGALPCAAWLDGTTPGEERMAELLELLMEKGVVTLNLVPDRSWNIADPAQRQLKVQKLVEVVDLARALDLPLNVGTEMNSYGQKLVDDFDAQAMRPLRQDFLDGAYFIYGHTAMQRALGMGFQSAWAKDQLAARRERNRFYTRIGRVLPPGAPGARMLAHVTPNDTPQEILSGLEDW